MIINSSIDDIKPLFEEVYRKTFSPNIPKLEEAIEGEVIYSYFDNSILGFATVWEEDFFIHFLFVKESERHKKIGTKLIKHLLSTYNSPLKLKCLIKNEGALKFYKKLGFKELSRGYSEDGEYALLSIDKILDSTL